LLAQRNRIYNWHYLGGMKRRLRRRQRVLGERWISFSELGRIQTLWEIDDRVTGPSFGFQGAEHYYATQSSLRLVPEIRVPCLLVQAKDDPMIPFSLFEGPEVRGNRRIELVSPQHGGHIGFLARGTPRVWLDGVAVEWVRRA
jgi:predicted alpha/beta-fold hydrolase